MKTKLLLSTLLVAGIVGLNSLCVSEAATSASQKVCGTLGTCRTVVNTTPGAPAPVTQAIDCDTGALAATLVTTFNAITNNGSNQTMSFSASSVVSDGSGTTDAFYYDSGVMYVALTNETDVPATASVTNALQVADDQANNPDVIAYPFTLAAAVTTGTGSVTVNVPSDTDTAWDIDLDNQGVTGFTGTTLTSARTDTYGFSDSPGNYCSTVTLSFVGP